MAGILDIFTDLKSLNYKVIASHTTAYGLCVYANVGNKQIVKFEVKMNAKKEVESLLKHSPFFVCNGSYSLQKERADG